LLFGPLRRHDHGSPMSGEVPRLRRIRSQVFSTSQRTWLDRGFTVLSHTAYALGIPWSLKFLPLEDPCPSRGRDVPAVPPGPTAAPAHRSSSLETFKDGPNRTPERCRPNTDPELLSPTRARSHPRFRRVTPPSPGHDRPRSTCVAGHMNRTADFDVFLPSRIRHPPVNRRAATPLTLPSLKRPSAGLRTIQRANLESNSCAPNEPSQSRTRRSST
jgi:hypothetical protein